MTSPHSELFLRSRSISFAPCGDDRFLITHDSGRSAHLSELVVRLWMHVSDETPRSWDALIDDLESGYATVTGDAVVDADRRQIRAVCESLIALGAIESITAPDSYGAVADTYDARPTPLGPVFERLIRDTGERHRRGVVLEVGCGTGAVLEKLADFAPAVLHGIEPAEPMLAGARRRLADCPTPVRLQRAAAERLPIDDRSVDLVVVATALHWFDKERFWREVRRVVSADHRVVLWNSVLAADSENPLTAYFGQHMSAGERRAALREDAGALLRDLPPWVDIISAERFAVTERYEDPAQLAAVARSWCPPELVGDYRPLDTNAVDRWPLEVPYAMSFAALELL